MTTKRGPGGDGDGDGDGTADAGPATRVGDAKDERRTQEQEAALQAALRRARARQEASGAAPKAAKPGAKEESASTARRRQIAAAQAAAAAQSPLPEKLGRYTLVKRLGIGGMAEVFLAEQEGAAGFKKRCVVKRMLSHLALQERFVEMFLREAHLASTLSHPNIVQIWDLGEVNGTFFIAMEYVEGLPMNVLARTAWRANRPVPLELVCCALADAAAGLVVAHERVDPATGQAAPIIHRDISPDNLMIDREGQTKLLDFGIARATGGEHTKTGELKGKVPFMTPEQLRGEQFDGRIDIFALGVSAYWLLTGKRPFTGATDMLIMQAILTEEPPPPQRLNPRVPDGINDLVMRMVEKDANKRVSSARYISTAFEEILPTRRTVVAPFVREIMAMPEQPKGAKGEDPGSAPSGFLPSTPHTDTLNATWKRLLIAEVRSNVREVRPAMAVTPSSPSQPPAPAGEVVGHDTQDDVPPPTAQLAQPQASPDEQQQLAQVAQQQVQVAQQQQQAHAHADEPELASADDVVDLAPAPPRRSPVLAIAAVLGVVALGAAAVVVWKGRDARDGDNGALAANGAATPATTTATPTGAPPTTTAAPPTTTMAPPTTTPVTADEPDAPDVPDEPKSGTKKPVPAAKRAIAAKGPAFVQWIVDGKNAGSGNRTLSVAKSATSIIALDSRRGVRTKVALSGDSVDYASLPRGKLHPRAKPFADVFIGAEALGPTPFPPVDVVAGTYKVRFVYKGQEQTKTIEVGAGATARPVADFTAPEGAAP